MPLFLWILFLALIGVLLAHLARKWAKAETTNRRWILILVTHGLASNLIPGDIESVGGVFMQFLISAALFILFAKIFGRISWLMSLAFFAIYMVAVVIGIVAMAIAFGPEFFSP